MSMIVKITNIGQCKTQKRGVLIRLKIIKLGGTRDWPADKTVFTRRGGKSKLV